MNKSRAKYFKERRELYKQFNVLVERDKIEKFEKLLEECGLTKTEWLNKKIDEELKK